MASVDLLSVKQMLEAGVSRREISALTGIHLTTLSTMARAWGIKTKRGRPKRVTA
jgi:hypothetical protein